MPRPIHLARSTSDDGTASARHDSLLSEAYQATAMSCCMSILHHLVESYPAATELCVRMLIRSEQLWGVLCAGLQCQYDVIVTSLLQYAAACIRGVVLTTISVHVLQPSTIVLGAVSLAMRATASLETSAFECPTACFCDGMHSSV